MVIRRGTAKDADAMLDVFLRARERMSYLPDVRSQDEDRALLRRALENREVWVAEQEARVLGFVVFGQDALEHLYVHPLAQNFGVGSALLERAKESSPGGLRARVFQKNTGARRFFQTRGFGLVQLTDGAQNDEQEPEALYEWRAVSA